MSFGLEGEFKEGNFWFVLKEVFKEGRGIQEGKRNFRREEVFCEEIVDWREMLGSGKNIKNLKKMFLKFENFIFF